MLAGISAEPDQALWPDWIDIEPSNTEHLYAGEDLHAKLNTLKPGDKLIVHEGTYSTSSWYRLMIKGLPEAPIFIEGAEGEDIIFTRPDTAQNNLNIDSTEYVSIRNIIFKGGDTGIKIYDANNLVIEDCTVYNTYGAGITANSADTHHLYFMHNHIHHTGGHGEGFYLGANNAEHIMHSSIIYNNYIHHTTLFNINSYQQGDGIEIKQGSYGNLVKDNVIHDVNYPGIIVYGTAGKDKNIVEGNFILRSDDNGIQAQGDAIIRNNIVIDSKNYNFFSSDHQGTAKNLAVLSNTFIGAPVRFNNFGNREDMVFANNVVYNPGGTAIDIGEGTEGGTVQGNVVLGASSFAEGISTGDGMDDFIGPDDYNFYPADETFASRSQVAGNVVADDILHQKRSSEIYAGAFEKKNDTGYAFELGFRYPARETGYGEPLQCSDTDVLCVDDEPGDTQEYTTIQEALDDVQPGQTVLIYPGTYFLQNTLEIRRSGLENSPITIKGKDIPVIDGSGLSAGDAINVEMYDYIIIEGLEIRNAPRAGIRLTHSDNSVIRNNYVHHNGEWGIFTSFCDDILIEENECSYSVRQHGIYFSNSGDRPVIRGNVVHHNNGNGIHMNGDRHMTSPYYPDVDGMISGAVVENNILYENGAAGGSAINCDGVKDSMIRNNLIYRQHSSGISLYKIDAAEPSTGNQVYHNTIVIAPDGRRAINLKWGSGPNTVKNNILMTERTNHGVIASEDLTGLVMDNNLLISDDIVATPDDDSSYLTFAQWQDLGYDLNSYTASIDDTFVSFPDDLTLKDTSSAIDTGADLGILTDIEGNLRPNGNGFDIGCFESGYSHQATRCTDADTNNDNKISNQELMSKFFSYASGTTTMVQLLDYIDAWKNRC